MKVKLDIDQQYTEEQIIIEAPALSQKFKRFRTLYNPWIKKKPSKENSKTRST